MRLGGERKGAISILERCAASNAVTSGESGAKPSPHSVSASDGATDILDHMHTPIQPGLSDEKASRMLIALREGRTLRKFGISRNCPRFEAYCEAHSDYAG